MDFLSKLLTGTQGNNISAVEAQKKLSQKQKPFLLDVRQPEEFRSGHIPGAKLIPLGELRANERTAQEPANSGGLPVGQPQR